MEVDAGKLFVHHKAVERPHTHVRHHRFETGFPGMFLQLGIQLAEIIQTIGQQAVGRHGNGQDAQQAEQE